MSRFTVTMHCDATDKTDEKAVIGYDRPLGTFFAQAFCDETGYPTIWYGGNPNQFPQFDDLISALSKAGYHFTSMPSDYIEAMHAEAAAKHTAGFIDLHKLLNKTNFLES